VPCLKLAMNLVVTHTTMELVPLRTEWRGCKQKALLRDVEQRKMLNLSLLCASIIRYSVAKTEIMCL